jgi:urea transport system ATP-binding protein
MSSLRLRFENVKKSYGDNLVLDIPHLELSGGVRFLLGHNGSGKTTLLKLIAGVESATAGTIFLNDLPLNGMSVHQRQRMGITLAGQTPQLVESLTVKENVLLPITRPQSYWSLLSHTSDSETNLRQCHRYLQLTGLDHRADVYVRDLTLGERKLVELTCALVQEPRLLLLDEPTAGLGAPAYHWLPSCLFKLSRETIIVIVEHNFEFLRAFDSPVTLLHHGHVVGEGVANAPDITSKLDQYYFS